MNKAPKDASPDHDDRLKDFFNRHGGASARSAREAESAPGVEGWSEVYATDGYALRCEWSALGSFEAMKYSEIPPA
jgi:hypothetical protein